MKIVPANFVNGTENIYINKYGEVWYLDEYVKPELIGNELFIKINNKQYSLPKLIIYTYLLEIHDVDLINSLEVMYIDSNKENLKVNNITYRFKNYPIENKKYPGFYYIPFHEKYLLSKDGQIINGISGKAKKWGIVKGGTKNGIGGYSYTRVTIHGVSTTIGLHRALCLTFKDYPANVNELVINHLDGNPRNNTLSNLEWTTRAKNNQHAYDNDLRPNAAAAILVKNTVDGTVTRYPSVAECWRKLRILSAGNIWHRAYHRNNKLYPDGLMFKFDDGSEWPVVPDKVTYAGIPRHYAVRNVFTGEVTVYKNINDVVNKLGIIKATVHMHCKHKLFRPIHGYNLRYLENTLEWPNHTPTHLEIYRKNPVYPGNGVIVTDLVTGNKKLYTSVKELSDELKLSPNRVFNIIKNTEVFRGRYSFSVFKLKDELGPPIMQIMG